MSIGTGWSHHVTDFEASAAPGGDESNPALVAELRREIAHAGRITFARFMELALYHPEHGYYLSDASPLGRGGDFLTAPEASAYFGITVAAAVVDCWERMDRPTPFTVREYGAGSGVFAYDLIAGIADLAPRLSERLDYRLVEPSRRRLEVALAGMEDAGLGHLIRAEEIPPGADPEPITGVVIANEVADALPVHRLIARDGQLRECYVTLRDGAFAEEEDALSADAAAVPAALAAEGVELVEGGRYDVSPAAAHWFASACRGLARGYALVIDYGYRAAELFSSHRLAGTVRGYHRHTVTDDPFVRIGRQDLTAHVDFSALIRAGEATGMTLAGLTTQGAFLASLGLGDRLVALQSDPEATLADYASAQAVVMRLIDPGGLGRFTVLMMAKDAPVDPPLRGFAVAPPPF